MPERPDLRTIARDIRESLGDFDREALLEILTYVFKEYVVDGVPPSLLGRADTIEDLAGLSFPELMRALQTRLEHPELELFQVQDDVVLVRAGGALTPLTEDQLPRRQRPAPVAPSAQVNDVPGASAARGAAQEAAARGRGDLAGGQRGAVQAPPGRPAPPPARGISINGRPGSGGTTTPQPQGNQGGRVTDTRPRAPAAAAEETPPPSQPPPSADGADKPEGKHPEGDDAASIRFSLLELD